jgi:NAD+ kinase
VTQFKHIGLIGRLHSPAVIETLQRLIACLNRSQCQVWVDERIADSLQSDALTDVSYGTSDRHFLGQQCDLVIVVGGDGSMLSAARVMATYGVPMIGINRGKLGFLTDIVPDQLEASIEAVLAGHFETSHRFMLSAHVLRNGDEAVEAVVSTILCCIPGSQLVCCPMIYQSMARRFILTEQMA